MVARLAPLLGMTVKQLNTAINNLEYSPYAPVPVFPDAQPQQILYIQENPDLFPGVVPTSESVRSYTAMGAAAANILGYVGQIDQSQYRQLKSKGYLPNDQIGLTGVEAAYESVLRGRPGVEKIQVNSAGQVLTTLASTPPVPGHNLVLTIDGRIQEAAVTALEQGLAAARQSTHNGARFPAPAGAAVVEDPQNGTIVALATDPDYNPEDFVGGISEANYAGLQQPGRQSTIARPGHPGGVRARLDVQARHRHRRARLRADHTHVALRRYGKHQDREPDLHQQRPRGSGADHPPHRAHRIE